MNGFLAARSSRTPMNKSRGKICYRQIARDLSACGKLEEMPQEGKAVDKEKTRIKCKNCGQEFEPTCHITRQKFCSDECRFAYNNAKRHYTDVPLDICPGCGDMVEQTGERGRRRRFCSDKCRVKYWQEKGKERRQRKERRSRSVQTAGKNLLLSGGRGSSGGSAVMDAGSSGGRRTTGQIPAKKSRRSGVRRVERRWKAKSEGKHTAAGFVICWQWMRRT